MLLIQNEIFKYALDLMKEAELIKGLQGKDKLLFVQTKLKEVVKNKAEWDNTTKEEAFFFIDTLLPGIIELTIKFSKLQFVQEVATTCCGWMMK
jgi:hypothetical protein